MNQRGNKIWILILAIWLGCAGLFSASTVSAADLPFDQGTGYEPGAYDRDAAQPTAFNWTRQSRFTGSSDHDMKWSFSAGKSIYSTPAIGADGTLYVGSYDGKLYALSSNTGKLKWLFETSGAIASSPTIGADGTIYVGSGDGFLYALDPDAVEDDEREKWSFATGDSVQASPVIGADGTIYIGSYDGNLYALDPNANDDDEREIWSYEIGGEIDSSPAIGADGTIYIGSGDGFFYALDPDADDDERMKWSLELNMEWDGLCWDEPCPIYSSPAIGADGTIYVGSNDGYVYALDPHADDDEDRLKWSYETWGSVLSSPAIGADGTVYVGSYDGTLYALDPDAENDDDRLKWSWDTATSPWIAIISSPVIGADDTIYIGSGDRKLYALNSYAVDDDSRLKWSFTTEGEIYSSPVIGPDGTIYIGSYDHNLYAIGTRSIAIPDNVAAVAAESAVKLTWEAVDGATGYKVYQFRGTEAPSLPNEWVLINDEELITETEYTAANLTAGQFYWFAIQAVDSGGMESGFSEHASAMPYTNVAEVDELPRIQVAKGTQLGDLTLPKEAYARLTDGSGLNLPVSWDLVNTDYNPGQVGTYTATGELQLATHIRNPDNLNAELTVSVLPSNDAKLRDIQLNDDPLQGFKPGIYTYHVSVPYATEQVTVTALTYDPEATYEVAGGQMQPLKVGQNQINIHVTAADQQEQATYTLYVDRQQDVEAPVWPSGSDLNVSHITKTSVKLSWPSATDNEGVTGYRLYLNDEKKVDETSSKYEYSVTDSVYSYTLTGLNSGTTYRFTVKAYDTAGNESKPGLSASAKTLPRSSSGSSHSGGGSGGSGSLASNASLKTLEVWTNGKRLVLSPSFTSDITSYTAKSEANQIELKATAEHSVAKVTWQGQMLGDGITINLQEGENVILLIVQAEDGSKKTYTLTIERISPQVIEQDLPGIWFTDIAGHWAENWIKRTAAKGIVSGYPDGTFKPNNPVTRAEFTVMLAAALKLEGEGAALAFTDNNQIGSWVKQAVAQAKQAGIVGGYEDGSFRPNALITRAEMAVMIVRALNLQFNPNASTGFGDDEAIPQWAKGAVEAIRALGIVDGRGGNRFMPNETATRAEVAVMMLRMLEHNDKY